uniref:HMG box domain-containing protein n=1 Tax=Anopheles christyi TaxID=43041 RepID=A0A182K9F2_9DIPT
MSSSKDQTKREPKAPESSGMPSGAVCRPGKQTRNPYLNFLRDFRRKNCHLSVVEVVRQGAEQWRRMTDEQKLPYVKVAFYTPLKRRRCPVCPTMMTSRMRRQPTNVKQRRAHARKRQRSSSNNRVKKERKG